MYYILHVISLWHGLLILPSTQGTSVNARMAVPFNLAATRSIHNHTLPEPCLCASMQLLQQRWTVWPGKGWISVCGTFFFFLEPECFLFFFPPFLCIYVAMWPHYPECNPPPPLNSWYLLAVDLFQGVCFYAVLLKTFSGHRVLLFHKYSLQEQTKGKGWGSKSPTDFYFSSVGCVELGPALTHSISPLFFPFQIELWPCSNYTLAQECQAPS